jgi:hypothetical protein
VKLPFYKEPEQPLLMLTNGEAGENVEGLIKEAEKAGDSSPKEMVFGKTG